MAKDRARPFSRKHARYWLTAAGGMVVIMAINIILGFWIYGREPTPPSANYQPIPPFGDAGVDGTAGLDGGLGP
jgi:hypothetical protein